MHVLLAKSTPMPPPQLLHLLWRKITNLEQRLNELERATDKNNEAAVTEVKKTKGLIEIAVDWLPRQYIPDLVRKPVAAELDKLLYTDPKCPVVSADDTALMVPISFGPAFLMQSMMVAHGWLGQSEISGRVTSGRTRTSHLAIP